MLQYGLSFLEVSKTHPKTEILKVFKIAVFEISSIKIFSFIRNALPNFSICVFVCIYFTSKRKGRCKKHEKRYYMRCKKIRVS